MLGEPGIGWGGGQDGGTAQGESELQDEGDPGRRLPWYLGQESTLLVAPSTGSRGRHRWVGRTERWTEA